MNLYDATCPNCHYAFNIDEAQLSLNNGFVRCARCNTFFSPAEESQPNNFFAQINPEQQGNLSQSKLINDPSDAIRFDDDSGLDEAGNPIVTKSAATSPYALVKPYPKTTRTPSSRQSDDFEILDNFEQLPIYKPSKGLEQGLASSEDKNTANDENVWLESLMTVASEKEAAESTAANVANTKHGADLAFDTDLLDQIGSDTSADADADLVTYQQKIEQRLAQQVSSQKVVTSNFSSMNLIWGLGSCLLILGLVAQYIIFNINTLVTSKQTAARLSNICQTLSLSCELPIADTGLINVDTLKLTTAPKQPDQTDIIFTLTNTTNNHLVYPNLKISLRSGNTIQAQTLLAPSNYLEVGNNYLMPNQIKPIKLRIAYPKSKAQQANIELFY